MGWTNKNPYRSSSVWRRAVQVSLAVLVAVGLFGAGLAVGAGSTSDLRASSLTSYLKIGDRGAPKRIAETVKFEQFWQVWDYIKNQSYFSENVSDLDMFHGAEAGLVASLGDPYSVFFPPKEAAEFSEQLSGKFQGIGAEVGIKGGRLTIVAPLPGSPAEKAGLQTNDVVAQIDGVDTSGMAIDVAIGKIRGPKGTVVTLKILRGADLRTVPIERDSITVADTKLTFEGRTAIFKIYSFNEGVQKEFRDALSEIKKRGATGIILDLRSNPGGYMDAAVAVSSAWLKDGDVVVYEQGNGGNLTPYVATPGSHPLASIPTIVLVNSGSASAAEIVAGALQDHARARLLGETTFGKGSVQTIWQLEDGSAVKLTIASWLTPNKRQINEKGISPDVEVAAGPEDGDDLQLLKARGILGR